LGDWVGVNLVTLSFVQQYLRNYIRSQDETLLVGTVWWEAQADATKHSFP